MPESGKPVALIITADMTNGDSLKYGRVWGNDFTELYHRFHTEGFRVATVGNGYSVPHLDNNPVIDSALKAMHTNKAHDVIYMTSHGGLDDNGTHQLALGQELIPIAENGIQIIDRKDNTADRARKVIGAASEDGHTLSLILNSCAGDQLLIDVAETPLPDGTMIETFSQPKDVSFSNTVARASMTMADQAHISDLKAIHHSSNNYVFNDTHNEEKYQDAPSGSTILMRKNGETIIWTPRKSIDDRVGKGLTAEDKETIVKNYKSYRDPKGLSYKLNKDMVADNMDYVDQILKSNHSFEDMKREHQITLFTWMTYLQEDTNLQAYKAFIAKENLRRDQRAFTKKNSGTIQKIMLINGAP